MSCPIYKEIAVIRGSGLYPGDLSDDNAVVIGENETCIVEAAITHSLICRLEHIRFMNSSPTAEKATAWWNLRYSSFAGRLLTEISEELTPENCGSRGVIDRLLDLTWQIRAAVIRVALDDARTVSAITIPPDLIESGPGNCSIRELHRGLKEAVRFASGLRVGDILKANDPEVAQIAKKLKQANVSDDYPWLADARFPEMGEDPLGSCVGAAMTMQRICDHAIIVESKGLELARLGAELTSVYARMADALSKE